jgi:hypothetical protein
MRCVGSQFMWPVSWLGARCLMPVVVVVAFAAGLVMPAGAAADPLANLGSFGSPNGVAGGQLTAPRGLAVNRSGVGASAGSVYVSELTNQRISQFTADGVFVRAWGFDVIVAARPDTSVPPNSNGTGFEICDVTNGNVASDCKAGAAVGGAAGQLANPLGIAIDQSNGYLYVPSANNRRVDVFSGAGQFAGAFGWNVAPDGSPGDTPSDQAEVCTTTCQTAGTAGGDAGRFGALLPSVPAVDPSVPGRVLVPDTGNLRVAQYSTTIAGGVLTAATFDKAFGWDVIPGGAAALESCTIVTTCQASQPVAGGNNPGQFTSGGSPGAVAVDSTGAIYVTSGPLTTGTCSTATPCRIQKFAADASSVTNFGPSSGAGQLTFTSGTAVTTAAFNVAIDPDNDHVFVQRRTSATGYQVLEYDSDGNHLETHPQGDALTTVSGNNNAPGLAIGANRVYALLGATAGAGQSRVFVLGPVPDPEVAMDSVTDVGASTATFDGSVTIPSPGFATTYHFEYSSNGVAWTSVPVPDESIGNATTGTYPVDLAVTGLQPCTVYLARVVASTGNAGVASNTVPFTTDCVAPRVADTFVEEVTETGARLGAYVDPEGSATTYHFEWGTEPCSDVPNPCAEAPVFERQLGAGNTPVMAKEPISDLSTAATYHYRVVATNAEETIYGPDRSFETLNDCGLTQDRCYELVSPPNKGPVGAGGETAAVGQEPRFQAAPGGSALQYVLSYGLPDATAGEEQPYLAQRGPSGWTSTQLGAPALIASPGGSGGLHSRGRAYSSDLSCGIFASDQPLADGVPQAVLDAGHSLLYSRGVAGSWTTITDRMVTFPALLGDALSQGYSVIGMSEGPSPGACERVVFRTRFEYEGVPAAGLFKTYVWENGTLEQVAVIPGPVGPGCPGGACVAQAVPGQPISPDDPSSGSANEFASANVWNAVSDDASRVFFTAISRVGGDLGQQSVFLREQGTSVAVDVSQSKTGQPNDDDSTYQTASVDGSRVFFIARSGLAPNDPSPALASGCDNRTIGTGSGDVGAGCDLYQFSVGDDGVAGTVDDELTDVSVPDPEIVNSGRAGVLGVMGSSDDGTHVYFAARGRLVAGEGYSQAENLARDEYSVYLWNEGEVSYVGQVGNRQEDKTILVTTLGDAGDGSWTSQVSPDGRYFAFESSASPTAYDTGGKREAYFYSADSGRLECLSCRRDGQPSADLTTDKYFTPGYAYAKSLAPPRSLVVDSDGTVRVFFISRDRLASGAIQGRQNLYEWKDGQVSFLATSEPGKGLLDLQYAGASATGDDVYFTTIDRMSWEDTDGNMDVYDARVGGGFVEPLPGPDACDPLTQGACQSGGSTSTDPTVETEKVTPSDPAVEPRTVLSVRALSSVQRARLAAGRRVRLLVRSNRPGTVEVRGTATVAGLRARVLSASVDMPNAGRYAVAVSLSRQARQRLRRVGRLRVTLSVGLAGSRDDQVRLVTLRSKDAGQGKNARQRVRRTNSDRRAGR